MKRIISIICSMLFLLAVFSGCSDRKTEEKLRISCCSNFYPYLLDLTAGFEKEYGVKVDLIGGSSGKITAQIQQGAPYDLFFSADVQYPEVLFNEGFGNEPVPYCQGVLVMWSMEEITNIDSLILSSEKLSVAIPNPDLAPYGRAAWQFLQKGSFKSREIQFVKGENVSHTNQFVSSKAVDFGFTSLSSVFLANRVGSWTVVDEENYEPIVQSYTVLNSKNGQVGNFLDYFHSATTPSLLKKWGYKAVES